MREIGGYFGLESGKGKEEYHIEAVRLNTGANSLRYILRASKPDKILIPYYTCEVVQAVCREEGVNFEYYSINSKLDPEIEVDRVKESTLLYTNYFGIKDHTVSQLEGMFKKLIIDNAQAFFTKKIKGVDSFNSARKYFGVPDGSYLYTDRLLDTKLEEDSSDGRLSHLVRRIESGAGAGYTDFKANEKYLSNQPIKIMSPLTRSMLASIDYDDVKRKRRENYLLLHRKLRDSNLLDLPERIEGVPMVYPYLCDKQGLRKYLIKNNIFVASYWPGVAEMVKSDSIESSLANRMVPLPIDQRYGPDEMNYMVSKISYYD